MLGQLQSSKQCCFRRRNFSSFLFPQFLLTWSFSKKIELNTFFFSHFTWVVKMEHDLLQDEVDTTTKVIGTVNNRFSFGRFPNGTLHRKMFKTKVFNSLPNKSFVKSLCLLSNNVSVGTWFSQLFLVLQNVFCFFLGQNIICTSAITNNAAHDKWRPPFC